MIRSRILTRRRSLAAALVVAATIALAGCSSSGSGGTASGSTKAADYGTLTMDLSWVKDVEFAGQYFADSKGYYKKAGFSSTVMVAGPGATETLVASGKGLIGVSDAVTAGTAIATTGAPIKVIATTYQKNPFTILSLKNKANITTPQDMIGKKIGVQAGNQSLFKALLAVNNIPLSKVTIVPVQYDPSVLTNGEVDGYLAFLTDENIALQQKGFAVTNLPFADNGLEFVADSYEASDDSIKNHRAELEAFLYATIKGWQDALADPAGGAKLATDVYGKNLSLSPATELAEANQAKSLIETSDTDANGLFTISSTLQAANVATLKAAGVTISADKLFDMSLLADVYKAHPELLK